ncbi:MAG: HU family DNA-binding protein [Epsilonproteobacteria bacterium]|nr:HU family DNA-binding protein [Campylobacterota bacterium]
MKKTELIAKVAQATGLSKKDTANVIDETINAIEEALKNGEKVSFIGFGSFEVVKRAARKARVPGTNKEVMIPESKSVKFKVGKKLKEIVNS